ncbi:hypothetical protein [Haloglomus litoreum]|uniref:hypothetical protein n=1 Tax=Haloglomus litoreum TaxID=3034026 RepID=UPI0023E872ED|nr:hypothetical protein [Haloglomus sp. DT116]
MTDDQATLGSFAGDGAGGSDDGADEEGADERTTAGGGAEPTDRADGTTDGAGGIPGDDLVCPWCLAPGDRFVEEGPTGLACGRCAAALPVDADWFRAREVVARRPMYEAEG